MHLPSVDFAAPRLPTSPKVSRAGSKRSTPSSARHRWPGGEQPFSHAGNGFATSFISRIGFMLRAPPPEVAVHGMRLRQSARQGG